MTEADRKRKKAREMRKKTKIKKKRRYGDLVILLPVIAFIGILVIIYGPFFGGHEAPDFTITDVQGRGTFQLSKNHGKVVLIEFFSTTCEHCQSYQPTLNEIRNMYSDNTLTMISISASWAHDSEDSVRIYAEEKGINWYIAPDMGSITDDYDVGPTPTTIIVDKDGTIVFRRSGIISQSVLTNEIDSLLS